MIDFSCLKSIIKKNKEQLIFLLRHQMIFSTAAAAAAVFFLCSNNQPIKIVIRSICINDQSTRFFFREVFSMLQWTKSNNYYPDFFQLLFHFNRIFSRNRWWEIFTRLSNSMKVYSRRDWEFGWMKISFFFVFVLTSILSFR